MNIIKKIVSLSLLSTALMACGTDSIENYLRVQYSEYAFTDAESQLEVSVKSSEDWELSADADWLTLTKVDGSMFRITISENTSTETRECDVTIETSFEERYIRITQSSSEFKGVTRYYDNILGTIAMSHSGRYLSYTQPDGSSNYIPYVEDMLTGKTTSFPKGIQGLYNVKAIADDGETILLQKTPGNSYIIKDGTLSELPLEGNRSCSVVGMDASGSMIVGSVIDQSLLEHPVFWKDGKINYLETPDIDPRGNPLANRLVKLKGCSADGRIIYGAEYQSMSYGITYWKDGVMHCPGNDMAQIKQIIYNRGNNLYKDNRACTFGWTDDMSYATSPNGRYIAARFIDYEYIDDKTPSIEISTPAILDTDTGKVTVIDADMPNSVGISVDNEGHVFSIISSTGDPDHHKCFMFNPNDFTAKPLKDFFASEYGVELGNDNRIKHIGSEEKTFFGLNDVITWYMRF